MSNTICYKTKKDIISAFGTNIGNHFLMCYFYGSKEEAQEMVEKVNAEKPATFCNGEKIDWNKVDFFYVSEQEELD